MRGLQARLLPAAPGETSSTACTGKTYCSGPGGSSSCCAPTSTTNSATTTISLSYSTVTGVFTGHVITNQCPAWAGDFQYNGTYISHPVPPSCIKQTFPASNYVGVTFPVALPLGGRIGLMLRSGENLYGSLEQGFTLGQACSNNLGTCAAGVDLTTCDAKLEYECGTVNKKAGVLLSDCGTHANPFHMHSSGACEYDENDASEHSDLIGTMLDGRGIYGLWESAGTVPADLDACNGHYGPVPSATIAGVTYSNATNVYHYHATHTAPYFAGCYGPAPDLNSALALYSGCTSSTVMPTTCTALGKAVGFKLQCPPVRDQLGNINYMTITSDCPGCAGNCAVGGATVTPLATATGTATGTASGTATGTASGTATGTASGTATGTASGTATGTASGTATGTALPTSTSTSSSLAAGGTASGTATGTASGTATGTALPTSTSTSSSLAAGGTASGTATGTASGTATGTASGTATSTSSRTSIATGSASPPARVSVALFLVGLNSDRITATGGLNSPTLIAVRKGLARIGGVADSAINITGYRAWDSSMKSSGRMLASEDGLRVSFDVLTPSTSSGGSTSAITRILDIVNAVSGAADLTTFIADVATAAGLPASSLKASAVQTDAAAASSSAGATASKSVMNVDMILGAVLGSLGALAIVVTGVLVVRAYSAKKDLGSLTRKPADFASLQTREPTQSTDTVEGTANPHALAVQPPRMLR